MSISPNIFLIVGLIVTTIGTFLISLDTFGIREFIEGIEDKSTDYVK